MNPSGDDRLSQVHQRVINRVFGAGLTLAGVLSLGRLDRETTDRVRDTLAQLDTAIRELQRAALDLELHAGDANPVLGNGGEPSTNGNRRLKLIAGDQVFAYAIGKYDFYRADDHVLWAHESDGLLLAAKSGTTIARRDGNVFYDIDSNLPLYYEDHPTERPPGPSKEIVP